MNSFSKLGNSLSTSVSSLLCFLLCALSVACTNEKKLYSGHPLDENGKPIPYSILNPPKDITPAMTREWFPWSFPEYQSPALDAKQRYPRMTWTKESRREYENKVEWLHQAKYGIFFHFLSGGEWTSEEWNAWVDAVDVERVADQAKEIGAGYVIITLGQNQIYACAPNPVIEENWGAYTSKRDLPMDLYKALEKRGIPMMLYYATDNFHMMPTPDSLKGKPGYEKWVEVAKWYSNHYGDKCKGWWVDGLTDFYPGYCLDIHNALKEGNKNALVASGQYELSEFVHGHCQPNWERQHKVVKPFYGRWDPDFGIQWQVFQYIGSTWGEASSAWNEQEIVDYVTDVIRGGGVFTFDLGTFDVDCFYDLKKYPTGKREDGSRIGPRLEIYPNQMEVLMKVRDRVKDIPVSDGISDFAK